MQRVSYRPGLLSIIFILGVAIGAVYTPIIITSTDIEDDVNLEKHEPQNKSNPFNVKTKKKRQFAQIDIFSDDLIANTARSPV
jgi:hypothetical protein